MRGMIGLFILAVLGVGCAAGGSTAASSAGSGNASEGGTGTLEILANGEDFVRQGFVSKDGWQIDFEHVYITLRDVNAYQVDPPYDASTGEAIAADGVTLSDPYTLDLAAGDADADPILIGAVDGVATGQYNAMAWQMVKATAGDAAGYTLSLVGTAANEGQTLSFVLNVEDEYTYTCGEYVGDERKGFVTADGTGNVEATFHFDHVFGDGDAPLDDSLNVGALGFEPLAAAAESGVLEADLAALAEKLSAEDMTTLRDTLSTLGHVGEGHCYEATGGFTGHDSE